MSTSERFSARRPGKKPGIFCLEGDWEGVLRASSTVKPILKLLAQAGGSAVPFIYRDVGTLEELRYYLTKWRQKGLARYPVLYLALHGEPGHVVVGDWRRRGASVSLDQLAEWVGTVPAGRVIHFGSCETLRTDARNLRRFVARTQATAVSGYREPVDWLRSAAFEVLLFEVMTRKRMTVARAHAVWNEVQREFRHLASEHDYRMFVRGE